MTGFVAVLLGVLSLFVCIGLFILGPPDHNVPFYQDASILCAWDNINGAAWCLDATTGVRVCSWEIGGGWLETPSANEIPSGCWPQSAKVDSAGRS